MKPTRARVSRSRPTRITRSTRFVHSGGEGTALALLGLEDWRFVAPVFPGDTLTAVLLPVEARPSRSRPEAGIVRAEVSLRNQEGLDVQKGVLALLVRRRTPAAQA